MVIHLKGGDISNRGDVLMLKTVINQFRKSEKIEKISVHNHYVPFRVRSKLGLWQTLWFQNFSRVSGVVGYPIIKRYRETLGVVLPKEIDWVFDISGFCYTDYWERKNAKNMQEYLSKQLDHGANYAILPQAFGPFEERGHGQVFAEVANEASVLFGRDNQSLEYVRNLGVNIPTEKAPDLTTIAPTEVPVWCEQREPYICIVPNSRMVEERSGDARADYISFLAQTYNFLEEKNERVIFLLFEGRDEALLTPLCEALGHEVLYVEESDPVKLRGILGESRGVVASRYHALVSALSQGVLAVGTSWSHKYEELFADYGCSNLLVEDVGDERAVQEKLSVLTDQSAYSTINERLAEKATEMRNRAVGMWERLGEITCLEGLGRLDEDVASNRPKRFTPANATPP